VNLVKPIKCISKQTTRQTWNEGSYRFIENHKWAADIFIWFSLFLPLSSLSSPPFPSISGIKVIYFFESLIA
jgi:hypothetical protein